MHRTGLLKELLVIVFILLTSLLLALLTQSFTYGLICFLSLYLSWHLGHLLIFKRYLNSHKTRTSTKSFGLWQDIFTQAQKSSLRQLNRKHNYQLLQNELIRFLQTWEDAIVIMDRKGTILWSNQSATRLLGVSNLNHQHKPIKQIIKDKILIEQLDSNQLNPFEMLSPVKQSIILSALIYRTIRVKQQITVLLARDITKVYHTEQSRKDFVSNVSHELRTPLTVIKGFVELMANSPEHTEKWGKSITLMQTQINRMENLIDSLLLLSRIQQSKTSEEDKQVNVADAITDIIEQAKIAHNSKQPAFNTSIDKRLFLFGSKPYLVSIFSNLIFNAIIHNSAQCKIFVSWRSDDNGQAVFSVSDKGEGIAARHLNRLTERFYRADKGRTQSDENSTGLGLAIVKHALQYHEGHLDIQSKPNVGSQFRCTFPKSRVIVKNKLIP